MTIYENDDYSLSVEDDNVFLQLRHDGLALKSLQGILSQFPRIEVKNFALLQQAFTHFTGEKVQFGKWRPLVECEISSDGMEAKIRIHQTQQELTQNTNILSDILQTLSNHGVRDGFLMDVLRGPFVSQQWIIVAKGTSPIPGENAVIKYIAQSERKPLLKSDGKTDFYEMHFIDEIEKGGWLGEKIPATSGTPGRTVTGKLIPPMKGKDQALRYDSKTVKLIAEGDKSVLRAAIDGAVEWVNGRVSVIDRLTISGDVGVGTGNIDFSGSVIIHGTVQDTFSVVAGKDASILSPMGIGAVHQIISKNGDIYIRGGVYGHGKAIIEATGNIYAKHANDCVMKAGNEIHIGYYAMGSDLKAKVVMLDKDKGKLIGGQVIAESQVIAAYIGNAYERSTLISVSGFNRDHIRERMEHVLKEFQNKRNHLEKLMRLLEAYDTASEPLSEETQNEYDNAILTKQHLENELYQLQSLVKSWSNLLQTRGEGEVSIFKAASPTTHLRIKNNRRIVDKETKGTFYAAENQMFFE